MNLDEKHLRQTERELLGGRELFDFG